MNDNYHKNLPSNWSTLSISPNRNLIGMPFFFSRNTSILQNNAKGLAETPLNGEGFVKVFIIVGFVEDLCAVVNGAKVSWKVE
jgi:hypothetical protein